MARIVVVGAGVAGLATAARLADFGHHVTVLERTARCGGQVGTDAIGGVTVDTGPTTFTLPAVFRDLFRKTGRPLEREVDLVPVDPSIRYVFPDGAHLDVPNASRAQTTAAIDDAFGRGAGAQWDALIRDGERMWHVLRPYLLDHVPTTRDLVALRSMPNLRQALHRGTTLRDLSEHHLRDPHLRLVLDAYAMSFGASPDRAPAALAALAYVEQTFGTWTVRGGIQALVDALERRLRERGGHVRFGANVTRIDTNGRRVTGVQLDDGGRVDADVVVSTAPPGQLDIRRLRMRARRWNNAPASGQSVFTIVLSLRRRPDIPCRTMLLTEDGPNVTLNVDPHSDPQRPSALTLHADCPAHGSGRDQIDWSVSDAGEIHAEQLLGLAASRGVDLKADVLDEHIRTPYDLEQEFGAIGGRVFGVPWHRGGSIRRRQANRSPVRGLFFAGAGAHPGPGLPLVAISAALVSDLIGRP